LGLFVTHVFLCGRSAVLVAIAKIFSWREAEEVIPTIGFT
jgi:hypothetical protein